MRSRLKSFWENYKFRFVPWIMMNMKESGTKEGKLVDNPYDQRWKSPSPHKGSMRIHEAGVGTKHRPLGDQLNVSGGPLIVDHVNKDDKVLRDKALLQLLITLFREFDKYNSATSAGSDSVELCRRNQEIMHNLLGYSIERRKSQVSADAGTGVFLASGRAEPGSLIALYPGTVYMPTEPLFFPSVGNPFIFRCSDGVHIDGNDKWISKSIFKSCSARDKFRVDLPCCDTSWLSLTPTNPLNIGQYVNNRSKASVNNVVYQESALSIALSLSSCGEDEFPVELCKYLPNVWANPGNNQHPLRLVPLVAVKRIEQDEEILSSYFTLVHSKEES